VCGTLTFFINRYEAFSAPQFTGALHPDNRADPPGTPWPDHVPEGTVQVVFNSNRYFLRPELGEEPITVLDNEGEAPLEVQRDKADGVLLSGEFHDSSGHLVAELHRNVFRVYETTALEAPRRDSAHTLLVRDRFGSAVLDVDFVNERLLLIRSTWLTSVLGDK
jgi:hypothetical protein